MVTRSVQFPVSLPPDPAKRDTCRRCLEERLLRRPGIRRVAVTVGATDAERGVGEDGLTTSKLGLTYDPSVLNLSELRGDLQRWGCCLDQRLTTVVLPVAGLISVRKEASVQAALNRLPGVNAVVSLASQSVRLEFDRAHCTLPDVVMKLDALGLRVRSKEEVDRQERSDAAQARPPLWKRALRHPELSTAIVGGLMLLGAWITLGLGGPAELRYGLLAGAYVLCGWATAWDTVKTLGRFRFDIDVLMFAAAAGAASLGHFEEGALLLLLFALGESGESLAIGRAKRAIEQLTRLAPQTALRMDEDGREHEVPVEQLAVGDRVLIPAQQQVPADSRVESGHSAVNQAAITGESMPVDKGPGDELFAGTLNGEGVLTATVLKRAQDNTLSKVIRLVQEAQTTKSPTQRLTDRVERWYVPLVLLSTAALIVVPPLLQIEPRREGGSYWAGWFYQAMAFLTAASPCALAIGTPSAVLSGIARAARAGVLLKGGVHLENLGRVRTVAFDKTGTLTEGRPVVTEFEALVDDYSPDQVLRLAAAVEAGSTHPLAAAIREEAMARGVGHAQAQGVQQAPGLGITGRVGPHALRLGRATDLLADHPHLRGAATRVEQHQARGRTVVGVEIDGRLAGIIALADHPRPSAARALKQLKAAGIRRTVMLTGDHPRAAKGVARQLGIDELFAGLLPDQKLERIRELDRRRGGVAMVGDGVNDAPAMAGATLSIAVGGGSDVALETADVVLLSDDLGKIAEAVGLSRMARRIIRQNLLIALGVIAVLAPMAAIGVAPIFTAVLFHEGSTVVVVLNALRLLRYRAPGVSAGGPVVAAPAPAETPLAA